ncbi:hypothetical protein Bca101_049459 [Brassica carinata]
MSSPANKRPSGSDGGVLPTSTVSNGGGGRVGRGALPRGRQMQKTFNNIKITILCGFITILVLRGTIGVGNLDSSNAYAVNQNIIEETNRILAEIRSDSDPTDLDSDTTHSIYWVNSHGPLNYLSEHELQHGINEDSTSVKGTLRGTESGRRNPWKKKKKRHKKLKKILEKQWGNKAEKGPWDGFRRDYVVGEILEASRVPGRLRNETAKAILTAEGEQLDHKGNEIWSSVKIVGENRPSKFYLASQVWKPGGKSDKDVQPVDVHYTFINGREWDILETLYQSIEELDPYLELYVWDPGQAEVAKRLLELIKISHSKKILVKGVEALEQEQLKRAESDNTSPCYAWNPGGSVRGHLDGVPRLQCGGSDMFWSRHFQRSDKVRKPLKFNLGEDETEVE